MRFKMKVDFMKKDIAVAILAGFVIGVIVALTAANLPQIIKGGIKVPTSNPPAAITPPQVETALQNLDFTLDEPKDESVSDTKIIDISGRAKTGQTVFIESQNDHKAVEVDASGNFTGKLNLTEGLNTIFITLYDETGNSNLKTINVYYTSEKL